MGLKPDATLMLAATSVAIVGGTYAIAMPSLSDTRALPAGTKDIDASERNASWIAAGAVGVLSLLAKSPEVFVVGGLAVIGFAWSYKNASRVDTFQQAVRDLITPADSHTPSGVTEAPAMAQQSLAVAGSSSAF